MTLYRLNIRTCLHFAFIYGFVMTPKHTVICIEKYNILFIKISIERSLYDMILADCLEKIHASIERVIIVGKISGK